MSELIVHLDRSGIPPTEVRAAATRYLTRTGNTDLIDMLGLVDEPPKPAGKRYAMCERCRRRIWLAWNGACRRPDCAEKAGAR